MFYYVFQVGLITGASHREVTALFPAATAAGERHLSGSGRVDGGSVVLVFLRRRVPFLSFLVLCVHLLCLNPNVRCSRLEALPGLPLRARPELNSAQLLSAVPPGALKVNRARRGAEEEAWNAVPVRLERSGRSLASSERRAVTRHPRSPCCDAWGPWRTPYGNGKGLNGEGPTARVRAFKSARVIDH